jgi:TnpA family transposase
LNRESSSDRGFQCLIHGQNRFMPRRELLTAAQREALLTFPEEEENLLQYYTLSVRDLAVVRQHRGDHNRLGFAVQLCYLRYPGRVLAENETPPAALLGIVAAQLQVQPALWDEYARRDETRREHLVELQHLYGFEPFTSRKYREVAQALIPLADQTHHAMVLVRVVIEQLRSQQVIIPPLSVIERLCAEAITRAERRLYRKLTSGLSEVQRTALDDVLSAHSDTKQSMLAWLRQAPGAANPRNILAHIERLKAIRSIALPAEVGRNIHQNHLLRLARQGAQTAANDFRDLTDERRYATLVAMLIETSATSSPTKSLT